ncbi:hypothetical protein SAMN05444166_0210 [Singulisphaera sp. GP187]|uniref:GTPase-associated system all-helical protein GASH n=1 Tax=Singulisphaera sp. GP187 TaxID=1882752 RepID=UPI000929670A|nr:GTPase-associated system all-helical protein GASH [Singulisphaera sp. GP187]SIN69837.1 hypothetical protein SAMN05444166_0210 [Singulisphaera sp. GP187]
MLKKTFEWLRVVHPKPDNQAVEGRSKAVSDLLGKLDQAKDHRLLGAFLTGALAGFEGRFEPDSNPVTSVVESIRKFQPAFPSDLSENALDLRVSCLIAIGEILTRGPKKGSQTDRVLVASLLLAGIGLRPEEEGKHLRDILSELLGEARTVIQNRALEARTRNDLDLSQLERITPVGDIATFWKEFLPVLVECFGVVEDRAKADREELEVLWWFYNAFSESFRKPVASLPADVAALVCGVEVGGRVLLPPHSGLIEMVADAATRGRKKTEVAAKALAIIASAWEEPARKLLDPQDPESRNFALEFPALLPLSWLSIRMVESRGAASWEVEFEQKTAISPSNAVVIPGLAKQAFRERVAQRLIAEGGRE